MKPSSYLILWNIIDENVDSDQFTYGLKKVRAAEVWNELGIDGTGITVGVLDTGIDSEHADLAGRVIKNKDFVSSYADEANDGHVIMVRTAPVVSTEVPLAEKPLVLPWKCKLHRRKNLFRFGFHYSRSHHERNAVDD